MTDLFKLSEIKGMKLKNHFIRSATSERKADTEGHLTAELFELYRKLAEGGVGAIITGYTFICRDEQPAPNMMGIYDDSFIEEYRKFTEMVHHYGVSIIMQLVYGGSQGQGNPQNANVWGPSAVRHPLSGITPKEMTKEDINRLIQYFSDAAWRAREAGFDAVQLHAAHGYLLNQFLSPYFNRRTDEYGGSIENRGRIIFEIYEAVRRRTGADYPVLVKINSSDETENGLTEEDSLYISKMLAEAGIDAIEVSGGGWKNHPAASDAVPYYADYAAELAKMVQTPVILTGGNRKLEDMQKIADTSGVKYFGFCRPLMADTEFVKKLNTPPVK